MRSVAGQIRPAARRELLARLVALLQASVAEACGAGGPALPADRVTTYFEELPVENVGVGASIITFS